MANYQSNLEGKILNPLGSRELRRRSEFHDPEKPWRGTCSWNCWRAESPKSKCTCKCHGAHHGQGRKQKQEAPE